MASLPTYDLEVYKAESAEDSAALLMTHNINVLEIADYVNKLKAFVEESLSNDTQGTTISQVNTLIESAKYEITIPVVWSTSTLPIDVSNPTLGTMTRTNNPDGSVSVAITNIKNKRKIIVQVQTYAGHVVRPKILISQSFVTLTFARRVDLDPTVGHTPATTDPNIKKLIIF